MKGEQISARTLEARKNQKKLLKTIDKAKVDSDEEKSMTINNDLVKRGRKHYCYWFFFRIVESMVFNFIVYALIVGNTIVLAMERYDLDDETRDKIRIANYTFTAAFSIEMFLKLLGLGVRIYCRDKFNIFDGLIVILSWIDLVLELTGKETELLKVFRALRLLRTIKLARSWKTLQNMLSKMIDAMKDISNFTVLLSLMIFIFALLGMELFAFTVAIDNEGELVYEQEKI